jgi:hypothetical protein
MAFFLGAVFGATIGIIFLALCVGGRENNDL